MVTSRSVIDYFCPGMIRRRSILNVVEQRLLFQAILDVTNCLIIHDYGDFLHIAKFWVFILHVNQTLIIYSRFKNKLYFESVLKHPQQGSHSLIGQSTFRPKENIRKNGTDGHATTTTPETTLFTGEWTNISDAQRSLITHDEQVSCNVRTFFRTKEAYS